MSIDNVMSIFRDPFKQRNVTMIASIQGILDARRAGYIIVRVGGFSIRVFTPTTTSSHLGEVGTDVSLFT